MKKLILPIISIISFLGMIVYVSCYISHARGYADGLNKSYDRLQPIINKQSLYINMQDTLIGRQSELIDDLMHKIETKP